MTMKAWQILSKRLLQNITPGIMSKLDTLPKVWRNNIEKLILFQIDEWTIFFSQINELTMLFQINKLTILSQIN